jgi:membrane protein implicated in regulation of membrane protease activity
MKIPKTWVFLFLGLTFVTTLTLAFLFPNQRYYITLGMIAVVVIASSVVGRHYRRLLKREERKRRKKHALQSKYRRVKA